MKRILSVALAVLALQTLPSAFPASAAPACTHRILVLSAMPSELDPIYSAATVAKVEEVQNRRFFIGTLEGHDVVLAMTAIGTVDAAETTKLALSHFRCGSRTAISNIVFSGVSGGQTNIGDVTIPSTWTLDGKHFMPANPAMFKVARNAVKTVELEQETPAGDPACFGTDPSLVRTVSVDQKPAFIVGGKGQSSDPFGGNPLPCIPGGGDVFGCDPCLSEEVDSDDASAFATRAQPFLNLPQFFSDYNDWQSSAGSGYVAVDMETAAVAKVASEQHVPFLAFRALSDGKGDPLGLPGFPFQFFYYRQLAANNAAKAAVAFIAAWPGK